MVFEPFTVITRRTVCTLQQNPLHPDIMNKECESAAEKATKFWTCHRCTYAENDVAVNEFNCKICLAPKQRESAKSAELIFPLYREELLLELDNQRKKKSRKKQKRNLRRMHYDHDAHKKVLFTPLGLLKPNDNDRIKKLAKKCSEQMQQQMQLFQRG